MRAGMRASAILQVYLSMILNTIYILGPYSAAFAFSSTIYAVVHIRWQKQVGC